MYQNIKKQAKPFHPRANIVRSKEGSTISDRTQILERWKQHFDELLNRENESPEMQKIHTAEIFVNEPTIDEVIDATNKMKNYKSCGEDGIPSELLKYGGPALTQEIYKLVKKIWCSNTIPKEWLTSIIIPIHKKGDKAVCHNYRGISLLNAGYKIFTNILYARLNSYAEEIIGDYQCGFRSNRSTIDQGFTVQQIFEKFYEHSMDIFCLFVDFRQAFDSLNRKLIKFYLQKLGIPLKLIELINITLTHNVGKVWVNGEKSDAFQILSGVKQGDALSALIFNLVLHAVIAEINPKGTLFNEPFQLCAYADDVLIMAKEKPELMKVFKTFEQKTSEAGLRINAEKTKYMIRSSSDHSNTDLTIGNYTFENVKEFKYLGFILSASKDSSICIIERVQAANRAYYMNIKLLKSKILSRAQKLRMYKTLIRPILTYGAELWTLKINDIKQLLGFERRVIRKIYGPVRMNDGTYRLRYNDEIEDVLQNQNVVRFIKAQRIRWLGHVMRMSKNAVARKAFELYPIGGRRKGRPRKRWSEDVELDMKTLGVRNWRDAVKDRLAWRNVVDEAMVHTGL